jgi:hypothetical protein
MDVIPGIMLKSTNDESGGSREQTDIDDPALNQFFTCESPVSIEEASALISSA